MLRTITAIYYWLTHRPAYMFMTAADEAMPAQSPQRFSHVWIGLMLLSAAWGVATALLYGVAWAIFGDLSGLHLIPVTVVVSVWSLWLYRRGLLALGGLLCGRGAENRALGASVFVAAAVLGMLGLESWQPDWPTYLPWVLQWIPRTMFRVMILAPIWGAWAMLIVPRFVRPNGRTGPHTACFTAGCGALTAAMCMVVPLGPTLLAFRTFGWWHLSVPVAAIVSAVLGGVILCRRNGGLSRDCLLAVNVLTQIVFVGAYLALIR